MTNSIIRDLPRQASYQIEAMCFALQNAARAQDTDALPYLVQSLTLRIIELNAAWVNVLDGSGSQDELRQAVYGFNSGDAS